MIFRGYRSIAMCLITLIFTAVAMDSWASSSQKLEVTLSHPASKTKAEAGVVVVTIKNASDEPILMPIHFTPISGPDGRLMGPVLNVVDAVGKKARYKGLAFKIFPDPAHPEKMYTRVEPGQIIAGEVNLALDYDLTKGGEYKVSYEQPYGGLELLGDKGIPKEAAESNVLDVWVNVSLIEASSFSKLSAQYNGLRQCEAEESDSLQTANIKALSLLGNALLKSIQALYDFVIDTNSSPLMYTAHVKADDRYTIWFGTPTNDLSFVENMEDRELYAPEVWNHLDFMPIHLANANLMRVPNVSFSCGCPSSFAPTTAAVARTDNPYEVTVCDFFFSLNVDDQARTLVHEISHFSDSSAPMTQDFAVGSAKARELAASDHAKAVLSADNFDLWVEAMNQ